LGHEGQALGALDYFGARRDLLFAVRRQSWQLTSHGERVITMLNCRHFSTNIIIEWISGLAEAL
jgi:hypothetical protein